MNSGQPITPEKRLEQELRKVCVDALQAGVTVAHVMGHLQMAIHNVDRVGQASARAKAEQQTNIVAASILPKLPPNQN